MIPLILCSAILIQSPASWEPTLDKALAVGELTRSSARFDESLLRFFRRGEFTTRLYSAMSENPWRIPWMMDLKRRELAGYSGQGHLQLMGMGSWMGWSVRRTLISNPIADLETHSFEQVLSKLRAKQWITTQQIPKSDSVPKQVRDAAALVLGTMLGVADLRNGAIGASEPDYFFAYLKERDLFSDPLVTVRSLGIMRRFDANMMAAGAHDLFMAVRRANEMLANVPAETAYEFTLPTEHGLIILRGGGESRVEGPVLLSINTGGDTTYVVSPERASYRTGMSAIIDTSGNDTYVSDAELLKTNVASWTGRRPKDNRPGPAGALLGYAAIWDSQGRDTYRTHAPGLGSGRFGFGLLHDGAGDDVYDGYSDSQAFGMFGGGILEDVSGNDRYEGFNQVQACGQTAGFGLLIDRKGDDVYVGNNSVIDFGSAQDNKNNTLMGQGAGNGRRADYLEGNSLAGGVGVLFDLEGNDQYSGAMFCQGVGYWEGVGALWDSAGADMYNGAWYAMGASAHFAIGYLEDEAGDDKYNATMNMALGAGHDFSVGVLVDRAGNDMYQGPNLSFGAGNANGIGWLLELAGNDSYNSSGITLGKGAEAPSGSMRERGLCFGVFMDLQGEDKYAALDWVGNSRRNVQWTARGSTSVESQLGVFFDEP